MEENYSVEVEMDINNVSIDKAEIEYSLGYTEQNIPEHFSELINEVISQVPRHCSIKAGYTVSNVEKSSDKNNGLLIGGKFFTLDKIVTGQLKKSDKAALFLCTIGSGLENWSKSLLRSGEILLSYIVDVAASVTAESVTNILHDTIKLHMNEKGFKVTNRYSPGYCKWPVSEQHLLFSFFPDGFCGVELTESALMIPIKSVSGIIGIGTDVKWKDYICDSCGVKDCTYRSIRLRSGKKTPAK